MTDPLTAPLTGAPTGRVFGIGVGPGDPELLTLKAARLIAECPVVAYPAAVDGDSLARSIAAAHLRPGQREIAIPLPCYTAREPAQAAYDSAAVEIAACLDAGHDVAVLCEGDPFFYGSFMYLFGRLADCYPVEVVPGVSALTASAAAVGVPLCSRNEVLTVLPAPLDDAALTAGLAACDAAALVKVGRHLARVRTVIERLGLIDRARYVERASHADQHGMPLAALAADTAPYFSMILIHRRGRAWL